MKTKFAAILAGAAMAVALILPAAAATSYAFFGDAEIVGGGNPGNAAQLTSEGPGYGGVDITGFPTNPDDIAALSFEYNPNQTGNSGSSPRLVVSFSDGGNAILRPLTLTAGTWETIDGMTGNNWDDMVGPCGYVYATTWAAVKACHAGETIDGMWVVNDSGWMFPTTGLTVLVDNITVNADVITFDETAGGDVATNKEQCKKDGWKTLVRADNSTFKNQGDCVSYTNNGK